MAQNRSGPDLEQPSQPYLGPASPIWPSQPYLAQPALFGHPSVDYALLVGLPAVRPACCWSWLYLSDWYLVVVGDRIIFPDDDNHRYLHVSPKLYFQIYCWTFSNILLNIFRNIDDHYRLDKASDSRSLTCKLELYKTLSYQHLSFCPKIIVLFVQRNVCIVACQIWKYVESIPFPVGYTLTSSLSLHTDMVRGDRCQTLEPIKAPPACSVP